MENSTISPAAGLDFLQGGGELGERIRATDWSRTSLGPAEQWPRSLRTCVRIMLTSRQPMFVWWGEELINLYNDAYKAIVGGKHPEALGQPASVVWREIWDQIRPRAETAMLRNEGTYDEALLLIMERHGYPEETYYTFSYSPVPGDDGGTDGIICANTDDTHRIIGERQLALLRELAATTADARSFTEACTRSSSCLQSDLWDFPFSALYRVDAENGRLTLAGTSGIEAGHPAVPTAVSLAADASWPFREALDSHKPVLVSDLQSRFETLPNGAWDRPPHQAVVAPIASPGQTGTAAILVVGLSPFRLYDESFQGFLALVEAQIAASIGNAQAYEEERRRVEALAELDRAKTTFFSNVSHEFRTPLTLMLGPIEDMLAKPESQLYPENRELLQVVQRNGQRLLKLVNTLLDFSRIEAGRVQAVYEPVDLAAYTADLASVFRSAIEKAGMRLVTDCPPLPEPVYVDRDMWEKIVLNLVSNAFKYTLDGEIHVSLRAEGGRALLQVQDTGTGIPAAELPNLFNRFHRVEGARGRTQEGTGIGLALVQELVRLHGGSVGVESVEGEGSTFCVCIPLGREHLPADRVGGARTLAATSLGADAFVEEALRWLPEGDAGEAGQVSYPTAVTSITHPEGPRPTVVLADDNADMRDYVRRLLSASYEVIAVADGEAALHAATEQRPDLVLTDVMMPKLDGFGLLRALRDDPRTAAIPVIMLSARAGEEARVEGLQAGADDYLTKPFSARELLARVSGTLALAHARREAMRREQELRAETVSVLESIAEGFMALDSEFRITYINAEAERINGAKRDQLLGRSHWEVYPDSVGTRIEAEYRRAMTERKAVRFENFYEPWRKWFEVDVYPNHADGLAIYYRDITAQKEAMEALQEADRRKDEFLATLAHELRNPLAPLRNGLEIMRLAGNNAGTVERARGMMDRQLHQMVRLVDDLLDLSRVSRGKIELRKERVDLAAVLQSAIETSRPLVEQSHHQLAVELPAAPIWVNADVTRLAQVFANLLNNAAKYTEEGGRIRVTARQEGEQAVVTVSDNGVGIPATMLDSVFEMFSQVDRSLERARGGLGIGLSIVKRLVEMHGGSVEARSAGLETGTEFTVRLPVFSAAALDRDPTHDERERPVADQRRILVVDENVDAASSLAMVLEFLGNKTRLAHDGVEALEVAAQFRPDVVLLDIGMPRLNGYDTCRRLRDEPWGREIAIIALTGWGQDEDRRRSAEAGFDHHLVKPVAPGVLEKILAALPAR